MSKHQNWLVARAEKLGIPNPKKLTLSELKQQIKDRTGVEPKDPSEAKAASTTGGETKPKEGEVLPPLRKGDASMGVVVNVPSPSINIDAKIAPQWHEAVGIVWDKVLHIALGMALYAAFLKVAATF